MPKAMVFIDGTWLYYSKNSLAELNDRDDYQLDYGKLPRVLATELGARLSGEPVDIVRTFLFGSYPDHCDDRDVEAANRRQDFFRMLRERYHYEVKAFPLDFHGRRLKRADRDDDDDFEPRERCVNVALSATVMYNAAIAGACDIAVVVLGNVDFLPLLQTVRQLGKRVAIASIRGSCCPEFADAEDQEGVKDFDTVWLDDHLEELELTFTRQHLQCESPLHEGDPMVWSTYQLRDGERFYCDDCRMEYARQRRREGGATRRHAPPPGAGQGESVNGIVKTVFPERGFGFIEGDDGDDYFFHFSDLCEDLVFEEMQTGDPVSFEVKRPPRLDKAGAAQAVTTALIEAELD